MSDKIRVLKYIPNSITCLNLASGCFAVLMALEGNLRLAAIFIFLGAVFDFFDGMVARVLKAFSEMGKELDSLADMVTFGVAPGMIVYSLQQKALFGEIRPLSEINGEWWQMLLLFSSFLIPVFSGLRLAKFNIDERQTTSFIGMPTPSVAMFWAAIGVMSELSNVRPFYLDLIATTWFLLFLTLLMSILLVAEFPMFSLKFKNFNFRENKMRFILMVHAIAFVSLLGVTGIPITIIMYINMSWIDNLNKKRRSC